MASRRDQLQSYQFLTQRVIAAFVMRETDPARSPLRRGVGAVFAGAMIAVLVAAGYGIIGLLTKVGGTDWRTDGAVVIESETGASFVYVGGSLHPTLNFSSALLVSGRRPPSVHRQSSQSLRGVPRGTTVGIPGAPDSLPAPDKVVTAPWTVCSVNGKDGAGLSTTVVTFAIGTALAGAREISDDQALLVRDSSLGESHLIWHNRRYRVQNPGLVLPALYGEVLSQLTVGTAWLNALPSGVDVGPIDVPGRGTRSIAAPTHTVGDLLSAPTGSGPQYYLVLGDGLTALTALQKDILVRQLGTNPAEVSLAELSAIPRHRDDPPPEDVRPPQAAPQLLETNGAELMCATAPDNTSVPVVTTGGTIARLDIASTPYPRAKVDTSLADHVLVPAGQLAVVRAMPSPEATAGTYHIVTDLGVRYAVSSEDVLGMLGYDPRQAVNVPSSVVGLVPAGPALDPATAALPAQLTATVGLR